MQKQFLKHVGQQIKTARRAAGLTQQQLADALDKSRASIVEIEAGRRSLSYYTAFRLSQALKQPICFFIVSNGHCEVLQLKIKLIEKTLTVLSQHMVSTPITKIDGNFV